MSMKCSQNIDNLKYEYIYGSINPRGLYNLTQTIIACYKNLPEVVESDEDDNEAFRSAMDMLDQIATFKRNTPRFEFK